MLKIKKKKYLQYLSAWRRVSFCSCESFFINFIKNLQKAIPYINSLHKTKKNISSFKFKLYDTKRLVY